MTGWQIITLAVWEAKGLERLSRQPAKRADCRVAEAHSHLSIPTRLSSVSKGEEGSRRWAGRLPA